MNRRPSKLSLRDLAGHAMCFKVDEHYWRGNRGLARELLEECPVGAIFVGPEVIEGSRRQRGDDLRRVVDEFQCASSVPLLVCADFENGAGSGIAGECELPHLMCLGASASETLAYDYGSAIARQAASLGVNWVLNPVTDVLLNPLNEITSYRALGTDPEKVATLGAAIVRGLQDHGVGATAKHFPGDGVDWRNQHLATSRNSLSLESWDQTFGVVYRALIEADVLAIMLGHIALPAIAEGPEARLPATLSRSIATVLLRERLGFGGVVVTDALVMGGFLKWAEDAVLGCVESIRCGSDVLLWPPAKALAALETAASADEEVAARLQEGAGRVLAMKERLGLLPRSERGRSAPLDQDRSDIDGLAERVAEAGTTLVRNRRGLVPFDPATSPRVLIAPVLADPLDLTPLRYELEHLGCAATERAIDDAFWGASLADALADFDLVVVVLYAKPGNPDLHGWSSIWPAACARRADTIVVSLGSPFLLDQYFESVDTCINACSPVPAVQRAVARAMVATASVAGKAP